MFPPTLRTISRESESWLSLAWLAPLLLPVILLLAIIAIIIMVAGTVLLVLTGLLTPFLFFVITLMALYAAHKIELLDVKSNIWLGLLPFGAFLLGLVLDKYVGILTIRPLSLSTLTPISLESILLGVIVLLLLIDVYLGAAKR